MKIKLVLGIFLFFFPFINVLGSNYSDLWKLYDQAFEKDLPRTELKVLSEIVQQAEKEKQYGHLLKAQLLSLSVWGSISPDSIEHIVEDWKKCESAALTEDKVLAAIYETLLAKYYKQYYDDKDKLKLSKSYASKAMQSPKLLAEKSDNNYVPFVVLGADSRIFNHDLLHVIGFENKAYEKLHRYYLDHGNRPAACLTALMAFRQEGEERQRVSTAKLIFRLDSLINEYEDLKEAGEIAIERYRMMETSDKYTVEDKYNYINYALKNWATWPGIDELRNKQMDLTEPTFIINAGEQLSLPNTVRKVRVNMVRNIGQLTMNVYKVDISGDTKLNPMEDKDYRVLKSLSTLIPDATKSLRFIGLPPYKESTDSMNVIPLPVGVYMLEIVSDNNKVKPQRALLHVSNLFVVTEEFPKHKLRIVVLNATNGQPVAKAKVKLSVGDQWMDETRKVVSLTCDENGQLTYVYGGTEPRRIYVSTDTDMAAPEIYIGSFFSYFNVPMEKKEYYCQMFTDRKLYRPSQQVQVTALVYSKQRNIDTHVAPGKKVSFVLRNANYEEIAQKEGVTDKFGVASVTFALPSSGLCGVFSVLCRSDEVMSATSFSVEEYKRPTFIVEIDSVNSSYKVGDTLTIKGYARSLTGVPVQNARVSYKVNRNEASWWRYFYTQEGDELVSDSLMTDSQGSFMMKVPLIVPENLGLKNNLLYNFSVEAKVTDLGGESHEGEIIIPLGLRPTMLLCDMPEKIERHHIRQVKFSYFNNARKEIPGKVIYEIQGKKYMVEANKFVDILPLSSLSSGAYEMTAVCGTDTIKHKFVLFSIEDKKPVIETQDWYYQSDSNFRTDGKPVTIQVGSSSKDQYILYTVFANDSLLEDAVIEQSNTLTNQQYVYHPSYKDGLLVTYAWVKNGKLYTHEASLRRPVPDKSLIFSWTSFRDRLTPGQKETWTLHITDANGKAAVVQMMATMYDKALDGIRKHSWNFTLPYRFTLPSTTWSGGRLNMLDLYGFHRMSMYDVKELDFSHFYKFDLRYNRHLLGGTQVLYNSASIPMRSRAKEANGMPMMQNVVEVSDVKIKGSGMVPVNKLASQGSKESTLSLRENFNETAFFYPAVATDDKGNVTLKFTLPESITTWHLMAFAHDEAMNYGLLQRDIVASKKVMIQPNLPRFLRIGDRANVVARVFNSSNNIVRGKAVMQLIDPQINKVVFEESQNYELQENDTKAVHFNVNTESLKNKGVSAGLLICRMMVEGKDYRDGEQHYLPLLSDEELVTSTLPFTITGKRVANIDVCKILPEKVESARMVVEYTNNPSWLMIQALPNLGEAIQEDAISQAGAFYANSLTRYIMASSPYIKTTLELWKREIGNGNSLLSNLHKNQELKSMLLNETPWVKSANMETEQKQQLIQFFDESNVDARLSKNIELLRSLQNPDGSWSWWKGMNGSFAVTVQISKMLVRLNRMTKENVETSSLLSSAFNFMGREMIKEVKEMRRMEKNVKKLPFPSETAVEFLYLCALDGRKLPADVEKSNRYMIEKLMKLTHYLTIYGKANSAYIMAKNNHMDRAQEFLKSLWEYSVYDEEKGRYFDTRKAQYSWFDYKIPTQTAAIEVLKLLKPSKKNTIEELQRWLLQEKRTTYWISPINASNAVYAFLDGREEKELGDNSRNTAVLKWNGRKINVDASAGLGYIKAEIKSDKAGILTVEKNEDGTSWGSVYAQYMQKADKVKHASGFSIKREVLNEHSILQIGDKVKVRITITADRDYDFVQVVDKRAACMEPVNQVSGYDGNCYVSAKDYTTAFYFDKMRKGKHVIESEYYIDRKGVYTSGTCCVQCAYSPEYTASISGESLQVK